MQPTEAKQTCPDCGTELAPGGIHGLCPVCLMQQGLLISVVDGQSLSHSASQAGRNLRDPQRHPAPSIQELQGEFEQLELLELIGQGGMGAVYKVRQKGLGRMAALKILPRELGAGENFARRFTREAQALAKLNHPNIVGIYDFGQTPGGWYYLLMEHVEGVNLRQVLRQGRMAPARALAIVPQICDALKYAHDSGVIHRDIKPENILLDRAGAVKIADFGLAKLGTENPQAIEDDQTQDATITRQGQTMGTPHYMAPEQLEHSHEVDHRADIYSLGVVFYELLTGELPLGRFDPPSSRARLDVRLDEVVLRTLEKEPSRRYQHVGQVKTDVQTILDTDPPHSGLNRNPPTQAERENALKLVKWPARLMGLVGAGNMLFGLFFGVYTLAERTNDGELNIAGILLFATFMLGGIIIFWAFTCLKDLRRPWIALTGAILAMLTPPGFLLGLPVGLWAIEVMHRFEIRRCMSDPEWHGPRSTRGDKGVNSFNHPKVFLYAALPGLAALFVPWAYGYPFGLLWGFDCWYGQIVGIASLCALLVVLAGNQEGFMRQIRWKVVTFAGIICITTVGWFIFRQSPVEQAFFHFTKWSPTEDILHGYKLGPNSSSGLNTPYYRSTRLVGPFVGTTAGLLLLAWGLSGWKREADDDRHFFQGYMKARSTSMASGGGDGFGGLK